MDTLMALGINEAALIIEEGVCERPGDMDVAMVFGTGFPPYRGGVLRYADQWGIGRVVDKLAALQERYGQRFAPAGLLERMARQAKTFH